MQKNKKEIEKILADSIDIINSSRVDKKKIKKDLDNDISNIDSLGLVILIMNIEEKIFEKYKKKIKVNTIISQRKKQNLHSIVKYIYEKL
jgi:acyl carrier protein